MSERYDIDDLISVLDDRTRREVLHYLAGGPGRRTHLHELAEFVRSTRSDADEAVDHDELSLRLHHLHLPKLADVGLIEFDPGSGEVRYLPDPKTETLLEHIRGVEGDRRVDGPGDGGDYPSL